MVVLAVNVVPETGRPGSRGHLFQISKENIVSSSPLLLKPACIKTLSAVEAHPERSNQHEFNGVVELKQIFGLAGFSRPAKFSIRGTSISMDADVTWYDARSSHPTRTEHRLYFQTNTVMCHANEGDNILIGFDKSNNIHIVLIPRGATGYNPGISGWQATQVEL